MNISPQKTKHFVNNLSESSKRILLYWILLLCVVLSGCQSVTQEAFQPSTLSPTRIGPRTSITAPLVATTTSAIVTPVVPVQELVVPSPDTELATPSPEITIITPSPTPFIVEGFVLYGVNIKQEEQIYALQPGGKSHFITTGQILSGQAFSPDETKIIVDTNDQSQPSRSPDKVFIFDLKTGEMLPLNLQAYPQSGVFWSNDGSSLLYIARYSDERPDQLILYDVATGKNRVLFETEHLLDTDGWSTDGQTVAFVAKVDGLYDLFTVNSETLEWEQLTSNSDIETMILWSPVAPQLLVGTILDERAAFEAWPWGIETLYLFDKDSGDWEWLADRYLTSESVSWSPEGKQIVFEAAGLLCIKNLETTTEICPLADVAPFNEYWVSSRTRPVWSPGGDWLSFRANNGTCNVVYFLELETNSIIPGDFGCDISRITPLSPIYWLSADLPESPN